MTASSATGGILWLKNPITNLPSFKEPRKNSLKFFLVIWQLKMNHLLTIYRRKRSLLKRNLNPRTGIFNCFLWLVKFAKLMGDDMNFEKCFFRCLCLSLRILLHCFFSKRKTWHETEIECHDSLSNQSSSIFKEVEIGIFFILVSFLSTTKKSLSAERYQDDHYITWQLSKKHSDKKVTSFRYVSDFYNMDWTEENDFLDPLEPFFVALLQRFFASFNLPLS